MGVREIVSGVIGGIIASLCCIGPTIITLVGIGGLFGVSGVCYAQYRPQFLLAGLLFVGVAMVLHSKKIRDRCGLPAKKRLIYIFIPLISMVITYALIIYFLVPTLQLSVNSGFCEIG